MPDFDVDFCKDRRGEVIEYVKQRYDEVSDLIIQPDIIADQKRYVQLNKYL